MTEYEFTDEQNDVFLRFLLMLLFLTISLLVTGVITLIQGMIDPVQTGEIIVGILFIVIALALFAPMKNFLNIITTSGNDIKEFMRGIKSLNFGFTIILGVGIVIVLTIIIGFISNLVS